MRLYKERKPASKEKMFDVYGNADAPESKYQHITHDNYI